MARAASNLTRNMTSDVLNAGLGDGELTARGVLANVGKAALSVDSGDGLGSKVLDSTLQGAIDNAIDQTVVEGVSLNEIDFNRARDAAINGFANGLTREAVHNLMDETLIKAIPEKYHRVDKKAFKELKEAMYQGLLSLQESTAIAFSEFIKNQNEKKSKEYQKLTSQLLNESYEMAAEEVFGKKINELSDEELRDEKFGEVLFYEMMRKSQDIQTRPGLKDYGKTLENAVRFDVIGRVNRRVADMGLLSGTLLIVGAIGARLAAPHYRANKALNHIKEKIDKIDSLPVDQRAKYNQGRKELLKLAVDIQKKVAQDSISNTVPSGKTKVTKVGLRIDILKTVKNVLIGPKFDYHTKKADRISHNIGLEPKEDEDH